MTSDELAAYLSGRGFDVKRHGQGWRTSCPIHEDPTPSVDWRDTDANRILLICRAGCDTRDIVETWGLTLRDLFHDDDDPRRVEEPEPVALPDESELARAVDRLANDRPMLDRLASLRRWHDPDRLRKLGVGLTTGGRLLFPVRRGDGRLVGVTEVDPDPNRPKTRPKAVSTGERDLWPGPEFNRDGELWLVEGESDAVTALMLGLNASGVPGAGWLTSSRALRVAKRLQARPRVYVCPDCDEPGRAWAERMSASLAAFGTDVRTVDLDPTRADGWDLSALYSDANGSDEVTRKYVLDLARKATRVEATPTGANEEENWPGAMGDEAYIGLARRIVEAFDPNTEADRAAILVQLLTAFGSIVGRDPHMILDGARHTCALFTLIVGQSAKSRKGTSWARVAEIVSEVDRQWFAERVVSGMSSGEGLVWEVRDPVYERTRKRDGEREETDEDDDDDNFIRRVVDPGVEDKRLLVVETEFAQTLRVLKRDTNTLSPMLRNLWDRGTGGGMTKSSPTRTSNAHVSIAGHITAEELRREMSETSMYNGFANRFLFVCARRSKRLAGGGALPELQIMEFAHELSIAVDWASKVRQMSFDADADALWHKAYNGELANDSRSGPFGAVTARAEPMVARLSMIYALLDGQNWIRPQHFRAGLAVWRYCDASARYLFAVNPPMADKVARGLLENIPSDGIPRGELRHKASHALSTARFDEALRYLLDREDITRTVKKDANGRSIEVYYRR